MEIAGLKVVLDGDVSKLEAALARGTEYLKSYAKYAADMFKGIKIDVSNIQQATAAQKDAAYAANQMAQAKLAEARAEKIRFDMANKTEAQRKKEKDEYGKLVESNQALVREYYNASAAVMRYGSESGISAQKLEEMRVAAQRGQEQLRSIEAGAGRFQRNVGNYASAFNPLSNSITQLTREMPAFANSVQTGFMAISNNIPAFQDAMRQIINQNKELQAQGKPTTSVFKQFATALFSWNTAISIGVTLLTVYGKDIVQWIAGTKRAQEAQKLLNEERKRAEDIERQANNRAGDSIANLRVLVAALESTTTSYKAKEGALKKLQETWPSYFANLDMASVKNGKLATQVQQLTTDILSSAKAMAAMNKLVANEQDILNSQMKEQEARMKFSQASVKLNNIQREINQRTTSPDAATTSGAYVAVGPGLFGKSLSDQKKEIQDYKNIIDDAVSYQKKKAQENQSLIKTAATTNTGRLSMDGTDAARYNGKGSKTKSSDKETPIERLNASLKEIDVEKSLKLTTAMEALNGQISAYERYIKDLATDKKNPLGLDAEEIKRVAGIIDKLKTDLAQAGLDDYRAPIKQISNVEKTLDEKIKQSAKTIKITIEPELASGKIDEMALEAQRLGEEIANRLKEQFSQLGQDIGTAVGEGIGDIMSGDGTLANALGRIGSALSNLLQAIGKMLIETGVKTLAARKAAQLLTANPAIAIGVGVATVAASKVLQNKIGEAQKGVRFADGGIVYGPTRALVGEYSNARSNPEVIAPLDKLAAKLREIGFNNRNNASSPVQVYGRISGQDILLSSRRAQSNEY